MGWFSARRRAARAVLLDPDNRVLLLHHERLAPGEFGGWYLPGGGIFPWESLAAAARREVREETGLDAAIGPVIGRRVAVRVVLRGRTREQDEWYLAGRTTSSHVGSGRPGDGERHAVAGHRWWTPEELAATDEELHPADLAALVEAALHL